MPTKEYIREYRKKRKNDAIEQLGGQCVICGSKESLEFDHIKPETKKIQFPTCGHLTKRSYRRN
jgi:5-methylcytosine-specific restriction endonuclease McrA